MKKVLSLILALTMLLGCSLMVFAAEPCEECNEGTLWPTLEKDDEIDIYCPKCIQKVKAQHCYNEYYCDTCGVYAYNIFSHYWVKCTNCTPFAHYDSIELYP